MKKQIILATLSIAAVAFGTQNLHAQTGTTVGAAPTTININLNDIIAIGNGSAAAGGTVDFDFVTADDYNNGLSTTVNNSLVVTSTTNFDVYVQADGTEFGMAGANGIPVGILSIKKASSTTSNPMSGTPSEVVLSTTNTKLMSGNSFGSEKTLDLEYTISGAQSSAYLFGRTVGLYTQTITYTATAI